MSFWCVLLMFGKWKVNFLSLSLIPAFVQQVQTLQRLNSSRIRRKEELAFTQSFRFKFIRAKYWAPRLHTSSISFHFSVWEILSPSFHFSFAHLGSWVKAPGHWKEWRHSPQAQLPASLLCSSWCWAGCRSLVAVVASTPCSCSWSSAVVVDTGQCCYNLLEPRPDF